MFANEAVKGLISNICKQLNQLNIKKTNDPIKKMGISSKQTFLQRRYTDGQKACEKMLNTANYQRNANLNYSELSPETSKKGHPQKVYKNNSGEGVEKREPSYTAAGECNLVQPLWRTAYGGSLKS